MVVPVLAGKIILIALVKKAALYLVGRVRLTCTFDTSLFSFTRTFFTYTSHMHNHHTHTHTYAQHTTTCLHLQTYGFPRVYRRLIEVNKRALSNRSTRRAVQEKVKYFFRIPNRIGDRLGIRK